MKKPFYYRNVRVSRRENNSVSKFFWTLVASIAGLVVRETVLQTVSHWLFDWL